MAAQPHEVVICTRQGQGAEVVALSRVGLSWREGSTIRTILLRNEDANVSVAVTAGEILWVYHVFVERYIRIILKIDPEKVHIFRHHAVSSLSGEIPAGLADIGEKTLETVCGVVRYHLALEHICGPQITDAMDLAAQFGHKAVEALMVKCPVDLVPERYLYVRDYPELPHPGIWKEDNLTGEFESRYRPPKKPLVM